MKPYHNIKRGGRTYTEHKFVWEQANGPVPDGYLVHHKNHDKRDNRLENLELMTHEEHSRHHNDKHPRVKNCVICGDEFVPHPTKRARQQTCLLPSCQSELMSQMRGTRKGSAKLTDEKVREIRALLAHGLRPTDVAAAYGISKPALSAIKYRRTWTHVPDDPPLLAEHILAMAAGIRRQEAAA